jgi:hypothetical protein
MDGGVVWMPKVAQVMGVPMFKDEGRYGKIHKICILTMTNIPAVFYFAGKKSKAVTKKEIRVEQLVEALACPIFHPWIIKFWAIHSCVHIVVEWRIFNKLWRINS